MKQKVVGLLCYAAAALATANSLDYDLVQSYGPNLLLEVAFAGSIAFGLGCLVILFRPRYGIISGFWGVCLCWPYFAIVAAFLPWKDLWWVHSHPNLWTLACCRIALPARRHHLYGGGAKQIRS